MLNTRILVYRSICVWCAKPFQVITIFGDYKNPSPAGIKKEIFAEAKIFGIVASANFEIFAEYEKLLHFQVLLLGLDTCNPRIKIHPSNLQKSFACQMHVLSTYYFVNKLIFNLYVSPFLFEITKIPCFLLTFEVASFYYCLWEPITSISRWIFVTFWIKTASIRDKNCVIHKTIMKFIFKRNLNQ